MAVAKFYHVNISRFVTRRDDPFDGDKGTQENEEEGGSGIAGPSFALDYSMSISQRSLGAVGDTEGNEAGDTPRGWMISLCLCLLSLLPRFSLVPFDPAAVSPTSATTTISLLSTTATTAQLSTNFTMAALPPQKFLPLTPAPKSSFLSLAPATSPSYPQKPAVRSHTRPSPPRRASTESSASSSSSSNNSYRILKLGPVHYGEHADEHKTDFHDVILH
ncbi:uncharacterized protein FFUJ_00737 [Fusarium fujikuroi IMI 58289]|uniref:Uncharacterized protein n=6 Tax=Fusarium TaxID=5506 RepID=S0DK16_GIBF5|nr:uncharacterized protein FFUJ_00737 [Fusarium fujikuroi IMI 58289]QGI59157.1 hypothetical protein CEK27_001282 [Fusarium fujikuroi]QGI76369.1 hypothetical protein CEK25_001275 [Fusarium fujikuroi]QGI90067.1 hypothetical protein CEK26_001282 [Fusarium fujikuroi]CCT62686.1 uncharacterized protein FFUJ_00737 [Fusarium fujikuroi IMI 58289]VTT65176.1 unnamed protein product [Fusarium fujikuroi]